MNPASVPFLWLCGASGVGKSSVGWEIFRQLTAVGVKGAYLDFDQIGFCRPSPRDDPDNHRVKAVNLAAMWPGFRAAGARCPVASGVVDTHEVVRMIAHAVPGTTLTLCRLRVAPEQLRQRIFLRGLGGGPPIPGDEMKGLPAEQLTRIADEAIQNADELEQSKIGDLCVDTDGRSIVEVAKLVRTLAGGWPGLG